MGIRLSPRLSMIGSCIRRGETVADIGSDHGYLPLFLALEGICPRIIVTDVNPGPLARARENLAAAGLTVGEGTDETDFAVRGEAPVTLRDVFDLRDAPVARRDACVTLRNALMGAEQEAGRGGLPVVMFRLGDGLSVLATGEVDTVVMAGMGGELMTRMLGDEPEKAKRVKKFIFQPRTGSDKLRRWIYRNGYEILDENLAPEGRFICEILVVCPGGRGGNQAEAADAADMASGALLRRAPPLLGEFLKRKLSTEQTILSATADHSSGAARDRAALARVRVKALETILKNLAK